MEGAARKLRKAVWGKSGIKLWFRMNTLIKWLKLKIQIEIWSRINEMKNVLENTETEHIWKTEWMSWKIEPRNDTEEERIKI